MSIKEFSESAKGFIKSPLGIIALFIILVYGFASLVVGFGQSLENYIAPLIYFMVFFPVIVFLGFLWLVAKHHNKLYSPSDFRDDDSFLKAQLSSVASLIAAVTKMPGSSGELNQDQLDEIIRIVSGTKKAISSENRKNRVLWVDDRPDYNVYELQAFEKQGLEFELVTSTSDAIQILKQEEFAVIISDMKRKEDLQAGYTLLDQLKLSGNSTPVVIYTGLSSVDARKAREHGALGITHRPQELFRLVMKEVVQNDS